MKEAFWICILMLVSISLFAQPAEKTFPYRWNPAFDAISISLGVGLGGWGYHLQTNTQTLSTAQISNLSRASINPLDRFSTFQYSQAARTLSDIPFYGQFPIAATGAILFSLKKPRRFNKFLLLSTMYLEGISLTLGTTQIVKTTVLRPRPFLYNTSLSLDYRSQSKVDSRFSFFSGHTSSIFYSAVFLSIVYQDFYPDRWTRYLVWGSSMTLAGTTGLMRILGGKHFPSDVLVGAGVGSFIGWLVPFMHKLPTKNKSGISWQVYPVNSGLGIAVSF